MHRYISAETVPLTVLTYTPQGFSAVTGESPGPVATAGGDMATPGFAPLYTVIDPDALNTLFQPRIGDARTRGSVRFAYAECIVTVQSDGRITVQANAETDSSNLT